MAKGVTILVQMVAPCPGHPGRYSLSSNPDITLDLRRMVTREKLLFIGQVNPELPYMAGDAELPASEFDLLLNASQLIRDGGTLQPGISSLGDAVSFFTILRHTDNTSYRKMLVSVVVWLSRCHERGTTEAVPD
ncbi:MAG: hypothetical protein ACREO9_01575, partial [Lysobacterales bacterium]